MKLEDIEDCDRQKVISLYKRVRVMVHPKPVTITYNPDFHEASLALYTLSMYGWFASDGVNKKTMIPFSSLEELDLKLVAMGG